MNINDQIKQCQAHKKPALFYNDNDIEIREKYPCISCCKNYLFSNQKNSQQTEKHKQKITQNLKFLHFMEKTLQFYELNLIHLIQAIKQQIFYTTQNLVEQDKIFMGVNSISKKDKEFIEKCIIEMQQNIERELQKLSYFSQVDNLEAIFKMCASKAPIQTDKTEQSYIQDAPAFKMQTSTQIQNAKQTEQFQIQDATYFKMQASAQIQHDSICNAMAFNKSSSELAAGYSNLIRVYQINIQGEFNLAQTLKYHRKNISCLQYMKNDKNLISGGQDGLIIIWECDEKIQWNHKYIINDHNYCVTCIKLDSSQNVLVSSGVDCMIRFYYKFNTNDRKMQNQIETSSYVTDLSFNKSSKLLFCCEINKFILIMEQIPHNKWRLKQKIDTDFNGVQICSFGQTSFAILDYKYVTLHTYEYTNHYKSNLFEKKFELQFNQERQQISFHMCNILHVKQADFLFLQLNQELQIIRISYINSKSKIEYVMKLEAIPHCGRMSEDKKYFAYWESTKNLIKIVEKQRKFDLLININKIKFNYYSVFQVISMTKIFIPENQNDNSFCQCCLLYYFIRIVQ